MRHKQVLGHVESIPNGRHTVGTDAIELLLEVFKIARDILSHTGIGHVREGDETDCGLELVRSNASGGIYEYVLDYIESTRVIATFRAVGDPAFAHLGIHAIACTGHMSACIPGTISAVQDSLSHLVYCFQGS